ncbi:MAG TPA: hypothetical protein VJR58_01370 [Vineibacter sp.]|nr:hypothetical protein [Vineibacter sp.]
MSIVIGAFIGACCSGLTVMGYQVEPEDRKVIVLGGLMGGSLLGGLAMLVGAP